ncbi:g6f-like [Limanda limanda]|uniref:g6f-like n=1 Tax=Limanda limanda TaxID=27771 RepID=UPI0029C72A07|nr:g6f-like [Limanda limanda]
MKQKYFVKSLRNKLRSAEIEIKALKEELIRKEMVKRLTETNTNIYCLGALTMMAKELKTCEAQCDALKAKHHLEMSQVEDSWRKKVEVLQEDNTAKKEMAYGLTSENNKLKDEVRQKDKFILKVLDQKHAESIAFFKCVIALIVKEKELKSCETQCDAMKASHLVVLPQLEETWREEVEDVRAEDVALEDEVTLLNEEHPELTQKDNWDDVVVAREGSSTTLVCAYPALRSPFTFNWIAKSLGADEWKLVLSAEKGKEFFGSAWKASMQLTDPNFQDTGVFSLFFSPTMEDIGLYSCSIRQQERILKERIILLAILTVTVLPSPIIPVHSTLRMNARVTPENAVDKITWTSPEGVTIKSEKTTNRETEAKLPLVRYTDNGVYVCTVHPWGKSSSPIFPFSVNVTITANRQALFTDIEYGEEIFTATQVQRPLLLKCPGGKGDLVKLQWKSTDKRTNGMKGVMLYDRWRGTTTSPQPSPRVELAGPPYNAEAGSFAIRLTPELNDGGLYVCEVHLNDKITIQSTRVTVMKVKTKRSSSKLELICLYSERSQVQTVKWNHQNTNRQLQMSTSSLGQITTTVPLPITPDTAGTYTCTLTLSNGQTILATQAVTLPPEEPGVTAPSMLPSLSALLLLVPLVAAAVGVLLWRQKQISHRDIEYSLSVQSGEVENVYENPDDIRQGPALDSVYMDLKPRGEDDVYKELERYEQCQS